MRFTVLENKKITESIAQLLHGLHVKRETKQLIIFGIEGSSFLIISLSHQHVILVPNYAYETAKEQKKLSNALRNATENDEPNLIIYHEQTDFFSRKFASSGQYSRVYIEQ